ncbi:MAG: proline--tRNA ligase [Candidatus Micrarchaeia archaeon]
MLGLENKKSENFSEWYTDVILKSQMADYAPVQGCIVFRELSYAVWEKIQEELNFRIKKTGHKNVYFPLFIPKRLLEQESEHVEGFVPEVAWVTKGGHTDLEEPLAIRPTSETIMYYMYAQWIQSHRDLPLLLNQWCSVVRWETKATKPFLRTREFLWQEGHTVHAAKKEANDEVMLMLETYKEIIEGLLAIPVFIGKKSEGEKFPGADLTTTLEALMPDGKALQCGTSHDLGQNFSKAFKIKFLDENEKEAFAWQTSWGVSTRLIGAVVMVHGDDKGLVMPPKVAPLQVVIVPIPSSDEKQNKAVLTKAREYAMALSKGGISAKVDDRNDKKPGWKYNEWELKGVPLRVEVGARDLEKKGSILVRRDSGVKQFVLETDFVQKSLDVLDDVQNSLFKKAKAFLDSSVSVAITFEEFKDVLENKKGFVKAAWCGFEKCAEEIKVQTTATVRFLPFEKEGLPSDKCVKCGQNAKETAYFAKSY